MYHLQVQFKISLCDRDCMNRNILLYPSGLYPGSFHPMKTGFKRLQWFHEITCTQRPPKYYFIDFWFSWKYDPPETNPREMPTRRRQGGPRILKLGRALPSIFEGRLLPWKCTPEGLDPAWSLYFLDRELIDSLKVYRRNGAFSTGCSV